jgi:F0F1-type ATP synthase membrane subunit b/b'
MDTLQSLGVNETIIYQFVIFAFTLIGLSSIAFKPYVEALKLRESKTKGSEELAVEIQKQSADLKHQYEQEAKRVSGEVKTIFDEYRDQANKEAQALLTLAREQAQKLISQNKEKVSLEINEASKKLKTEVPHMAQLITQKLLMK